MRFYRFEAIKKCSVPCRPGCAVRWCIPAAVVVSSALGAVVESRSVTPIVSQWNEQSVSGAGMGVVGAGAGEHRGGQAAV